MDDSEEHTRGDRRNRLRRALDADGVDALLVSCPVNVRYLTGFTGSNGTLLVGLKPEDDALTTDARYREQAAMEAPGLNRDLRRDDTWLAERVAPGQRLGLESHWLPWERVRALEQALSERELVPLPRRVEQLRTEKDDAEIAAMREACRIGDSAFAAMLDWIEPGMTEAQVALRLETSMRELGAEDRAFESIIATGPNGSRPHHRPGDRRIQRGDLVTADFGAVVRGYASDMTRTVAVGDPGEQLRSVHAVVRAAQRAGRESALAGATADDVDSACRDVIAREGHADAFLHASGHGIGLEIHEEPILRQGSAATLRPRMTVTVEPGVYLAGVGGVRVEDVVLITEGRAEALTTTSRDLVIL